MPHDALLRLHHLHHLHRLHAASAPRLALLLAAAACSSCIVVPRTTTRYDHACRMETRHVTLEALPVNGVILNCSSTPANCTAALVVAGVVGSASVVVSGSIAVVGNVVYWLEKQGNCNSGPSLPEAVPMPPQSPPQS